MSDLVFWISVLVSCSLGCAAMARYYSHRREFDDALWEARKRANSYFQSMKIVHHEIEQARLVMYSPQKVYPLPPQLQKTVEKPKKSYEEKSRLIDPQD